MQQDQAYSGVDNLEVMREAVNYHRYLLDTVRKHAPAGGRVLDFGAGNGQFALPLSQLGLDVTALEPDEFLRNRVLESGVRAVADLAELQDGSFDYIYTLNVLEHIHADAEALSQLHSKLAPGGTLLVYVPAFPVLYTSMDAKVGHVRRYTRKTLVTPTRSAGFDVELIAHVDSLGFFATALFKIIGSRGGGINRTALMIYDRLLFPISIAMDTIARRWLGKNLLLVARKRPAQQERSSAIAVGGRGEHQEERLDDESIARARTVDAVDEIPLRNCTHS